LARTIPVFIGVPAVALRSEILVSGGGSWHRAAILGATDTRTSTGTHVASPAGRRELGVFSEALLVFHRSGTIKYKKAPLNNKILNNYFFMVKVRLAVMSD
jgi:hypothetical protein